MIVRDEELLLGDCLSFAREFVDEIVVVDTGSQDQTIEIARRYGSSVYEFPWCDDFSAARNYALDQLTSDFVLILDADERLGPGAGQHIRTLISEHRDSDETTLYLARFENIDAEGRHMGGEYVSRLWRADPKLRYEGLVHEQLVHEDEQLNYRLEDNFHIVHFGDDPGLAEARGKRKRNIDLLTRGLAQQPDDPYLRYQLAREQYAAGLFESALEAFKWLIEGSQASSLVLNAYLFGSECLRAMKCPLDAMALALEGTEHAPDYGELWYAFARAALEAGKGYRAEAGFKNAKRVPSGLASIAFRDPSIMEWRADLGQVQALLMMREPDKAIELANAVRPRLPESERVETEQFLVGLYLHLDQPSAAWSLLKDLLETNPHESITHLMELFEIQLQTLGLEKTYDFVRGCVTVHPHLLDHLPVVIAALELAAANDDEASEFDLLRRCVQLSSKDREHHLRLARMLVQRGDVEGARFVAEQAKELIEDGS